MRGTGWVAGDETGAADEVEGGVIWAARGVEVEIGVVGATRGAKGKVRVIVAARGMGVVRAIGRAVGPSATATRAMRPPGGVI
jgi:hypothetical protein